jgi:hypothetical protein
MPVKIDLRASRITAIDFFDDLASSYARKRFFTGFALLVVLCLLLIWVTYQLVTQSAIRDILVSILIEVLSGSVIILAFYAIYVYFIGPNTAVREVGVMRPQDIGERARALPMETRNYMLWGRSGSFFRAYSLLKLDEQAKENKRNIVIDVLLPDPEDQRLVRLYREILKSLDEDGGNNPLLSQVLATCMACAIVAANNKLVEVRVHLSSFLPGFRLDLSDNGAILTQDDKKKSALYFEAQSEFYDMFRRTVIDESSLSRKVSWNSQLFEGLKLEEKSCNRKTLNAFGIPVPDVDAAHQEVAMLIGKRPHRYK